MVDRLRARRPRGSSRPLGTPVASAEGPTTSRRKDGWTEVLSLTVRKSTKALGMRPGELVADDRHGLTPAPLRTRSRDRTLPSPRRSGHRRAAPRDRVRWSPGSRSSRSRSDPRAWRGEGACCPAPPSAVVRSRRGGCRSATWRSVGITQRRRTRAAPPHAEPARHTPRLPTKPKQVWAANVLPALLVGLPIVAATTSWTSWVGL